MFMLQCLDWTVNFMTASEISSFLERIYQYTESEEQVAQLMNSKVEETYQFINYGLVYHDSLCVNQLEVALAALICTFETIDRSASKRFAGWIELDLKRTNIGPQYSIQKLIALREIMLTKHFETLEVTGVAGKDYHLQTAAMASENKQESPCISHRKGSTSDNTPDREEPDTIKRVACTWEIEPEESTQEPGTSIQVELRINPTGDLSFDNSQDN